MYFLAPGQAHDANNPGIGSLIHWMSFNDGFWISNDDCILMLHTDSRAAEIILPANSALAPLSVVRPGASQICYWDLGNYNCRLSASNRTLRYTITYIEHSTKSDCDYNLLSFNRKLFGSQGQACGLGLGCASSEWWDIYEIWQRLKRGRSQKCSGQ